MKYGSERFEHIASNNHNEVHFEDIRDVHKLVLGKDVALVLPSNPDNLDIRSGYPTHQESWLPMWYIILNHSQAQSPAEFAYQENIASRLTAEDYAKADRAVICKAGEFLREYQTNHTHDDNPKKKYKKLTRILQDILLYVGRRPGVIENQQEFLERSPLCPLIELASRLRRGEELDRAPILESKISALLEDYTTEYGGDESLKASYDDLIQEIKNRRGDQRVIMLPGHDIGEAAFYARLTSCDLLMARDDHDEDIVSIVPGLKESRFYQVDEQFGDKLSHERRTDIIAVPDDLRVWKTVVGGKKSYQPVSMIIAAHAIPESAAGRALQERLQKELSPELIAHHYLGAAEEFLNVSAWGKSYAERIDREDVPPIKKVIPLYRVATDLLPRAIYMLKTDKYPTGISDEEMWQTGETRDLVDTVHDMFARQDASQEELRELYARVSQKFSEWYAPEDYQLFLDNMTIMAEEASGSAGR